VRRKVDIIVPTSSVAALAAHRATLTIPIVVPATPDPVAFGFAASLARPGGNMTGRSAAFIDLSPKLLELLGITVPKLSRVAVVVNPGMNTHPALREALQSAAAKLDMQLRSWSMRSQEEFEPGFAAMSRDGVQGVVVLTDAFFFLHRQRLASLALKFGLPSIYYEEEYVEAGGLISYGNNLADMYRSSASFVDKIMKGAKPGDLPFEQPTRYALVINRKTAKALRLTIPQELLLRADKVIE
jgi:putative ABC transport system substrate-binding protein